MSTTIISDKPMDRPRTTVDCLTSTALNQIKDVVEGREPSYHNRGGVGKDIREFGKFALEQVKSVVGNAKGGGASYIETTYTELRELRDNGQLTKGAFYRITDYSTEVNEEFSGVYGTILCQSAHHNFDIIVLALSNDTLSEDAYAIKHDTVDTEVDDYFAKSNLSAWELKYSLDIDTTRYPWAKPSGGEYKVVTLGMSAHSESVVFATVLSENDDTYEGFPIKCEAMGTYVYLPSLQIANNVVGLIQMGIESQEMEFDILEVNTVVGDGKGIITMMKDEFGNTLPYDFKNIKWARYLVTDNESPFYDMYYGLVGDGEPQYFYTFDGFYTEDVSCDTSLYLDYAEGISILVNVFGEFCFNNVFFGNYCQSNTFGNNCDSNTFGNVCDSNTFGNYCKSNTFGNECYSNTFGTECKSNTFGNYCDSNKFGNYCKSNTFGNYCKSNTFGNDCDSNTLGNNCDSNTFGNDCKSNTFGNECYSNTFGNECYSNTFGNYCYSNTFGNNCKSNTFGNDNPYNQFEDSLQEIDKSDEVRVDLNTRRWYYDSNGDLQSEVMCYRTLS